MNKESASLSGENERAENAPAPALRTREALKEYRRAHHAFCAREAAGTPEAIRYQEAANVLYRALGATPSAPSHTAPNNDEVICPGCAHQFRAIPVNVQRLMLDAGFEPPFVSPPSHTAGAALTDEQIEAIAEDFHYHNSIDGNLFDQTGFARAVLAASPPHTANWPFPINAARSWSGFNVCGDEASIKEVSRLAHCEERLKFFEAEVQELRAHTAAQAVPADYRAALQDLFTRCTQVMALVDGGMAEALKAAHDALAAPVQAEAPTEPEEKQG